LLGILTGWLERLKELNGMLKSFSRFDVAKNLQQRISGIMDSSLDLMPHNSTGSKDRKSLAKLSLAL
jgi:hypothetical protein